MNLTAAILDGRDWCIKTECLTERFEILETLPECIRVVILWNCDVGELVDEHVHCGIYIVSIQTNVNFVPLVDVVPDRPFIHTGRSDTGQDRHLVPNFCKSRIDVRCILEMFQKNFVPSPELSQEWRVLNGRTAARD